MPSKTIDLNEIMLRVREQVNSVDHIRDFMPQMEVIAKTAKKTPVRREKLYIYLTQSGEAGATITLHDAAYAMPHADEPGLFVTVYRRGIYTMPSEQYRVPSVEKAVNRTLKLMETMK